MSLRRLLLDELVATAAARGGALELRRAGGRVVAAIGSSVGIGATPAAALGALADALGTPAVVRAGLSEEGAEGA